jgi:hypothetical protein
MGKKKKKKKRYPEFCIFGILSFAGIWMELENIILIDIQGGI